MRIGRQGLGWDKREGVKSKVAKMCIGVESWGNKVRAV